MPEKTKWSHKQEAVYQAFVNDIPDNTVTILVKVKGRVFPRGAEFQIGETPALTIVSLNKAVETLQKTVRRTANDSVYDKFKIWRKK